MDNKEEKLIFENFKISMFKTLLEQNLMVDNQLMIEFADDMIKSCSISSSETLMKLWVAEFTSMIGVDKPDEIMDLDDVFDSKIPANISFEPFNIYILKGDAFNRYLSVFSGDYCTLEFTISQEGGKRQASLLKIIGDTAAGNRLSAEFTLTSEEFITNRVEDYTTVMDKVTPPKDFYEFVLTDEQTKEIKKLVKTLHKSIANNQAFLTFDVNHEKELVTIKDKVFNIDFELKRDHDMNFPEQSFSFNLLKSDFVISGNHTYSFYTKPDSEAVILTSSYKGCVVGCLLSKAQQNISDSESAIVESTLEDLDIDDYLD